MQPRPSSTRRSDVKRPKVVTKQLEKQPLTSAVWQHLANQLPEGRSRDAHERRVDLFKQFDVNNNGYLSLGEIDKGMIDVLGCRELFNIKPVLMRAFNAAKNLGIFCSAAQHL
jgi:hypothetical protein